MKNEKKEKKQVVKQEQVALSDADLLAFVEDSQQVEFYNDPMLNFINTL